MIHKLKKTNGVDGGVSGVDWQTSDRGDASNTAVDLPPSFPSYQLSHCWMSRGFAKL
jgi:hypothetical protein